MNYDEVVRYKHDNIYKKLNKLIIDHQLIIK